MIIFSSFIEQNKIIILNGTQRLVYKVKQIKPRLHEQFLCDKFYLTIFICWVKPLLHKSNFYLKTKDWGLGSTDDIKKVANFMNYVGEH